MSKKFDFKDLLSFEVMLFPKVAKVCYLVLVVISILTGFVLIIRGIDAPWGGEPVVLGGLLMMTIVPVFIRLGFESLLVLFKIYDRLCDINNKFAEPSDSADTAKAVSPSPEGSN
ncbi:DUF4282 domain-containing protein [Thermodesulfovibrionales bacterium]|nr:DUF4282 domain-containing protein [Thermodesulfovibrionales bacterium]MCL0062244.1 DUF4282 domain-containing protein [Thermodesulfovibrionales bacterium]MCL0068730.1 DUF4282 domain-containing protein [Thermodesulfovibrionales bacterium]MCL0071446.1 DUF4282 domain-containing protein [Thermodesulfovibrionales bacterium]MCL0083506.1 DUF4282 domain-containing protein [Thermodesulfovibrionales bacterium]